MFKYNIEQAREKKANQIIPDLWVVKENGTVVYSGDKEDCHDFVQGCVA